MRMTKDQLLALMEYEQHFAAALDGHYLRGLTGSALDRLHTTWEAITGKPYQLNKSCGNCIYELICTVGKAYHSAEVIDEKKPTTKKGKK